ncbi:MATE family efflux transporter [Lachnospiraceae bacterium ZAX-1]
MEKQYLEEESNAQKQNAIVDGIIWKQLFIFFFPIMLGSFFQQLYNMVDAVVVGKFVGKEALAAVGGTTTNLINMLVGFFVGLSSGASVVISQYFGGQDKKGIKRSVHTAVALGIAGGFILMCVGEVAAPFALKWIGANDEIIGYALSYIRIFLLGIIPTAIYNIGAGILRAVGDSKRPLYYLMIACGINIGLDLLFVVVFRWGIQGAALATIISQVCNAVFIYSYLIRVKDVYAVTVKKIGFQKTELQKIVRLGVPAGLQACMYTISTTIIQSGINTFGTDAIAANTVFDKLDGIFWMVMSAFGIAVTTFVGQNFGAKKFDRVKKCVRVSLGMAMGIAVLLCTLCVVFRSAFFHLFTDDADVIAIGTELVGFLIPMYFTYVCIEILGGAIRGAGDSLIPVIITFLGVCVFRVLWVLFVVPVWHDLHVLLISFPLSWTLTSIVFIIYYKSGIWLKRSKKQIFG